MAAHIADGKLYHVIAYRGLRRGEAAAVEWEGVDLDGGVLTVRRQWVQLGWEVIKDAPKSDPGERTVTLDAGTVAVRAPGASAGTAR